MKRRIGLTFLALSLFLGCTPQDPDPSPSRPPAAERLEWLHGFYAISSYDQLSLADSLDALSLGWARLCFDPDQGPYVETTGAGGNGWVVPASSHLVTDYLDQRDKPYNLSVFTSEGNAAQLPDGTGTTVLQAAISPDYRDAAVAALVAAAQDYSGLTVDFEGLSGAANREAFSQFMEALRQALPEDQTLYVAVPPDDWYTGYDYRALGRCCDKVILMAHDYQWTQVDPDKVGLAWTDTPVAPISRVETALQDITDPQTGVEDVSRVALAISFSSAAVEVEEDGDILAGTGLYHPGPGTLSQRLAQSDAEVHWSDQYASPYVFYHDESGQRYKVWYEDARSVQAKIDLALSYGVSGLSLWRLGAVPNYDNYNVWTTILEEAER